MLTIFGPIVVWSRVIVETLEYQGFICVLMGRDYYGVPVIKSLGAHARRRIMHHLRFFNTPTPLTDHDLSIYLSIFLSIDISSGDHLVPHLLMWKVVQDLHA